MTLDRFRQLHWGVAASFSVLISTPTALWAEGRMVRDRPPMRDLAVQQALAQHAIDLAEIPTDDWPAGGVTERSAPSIPSPWSQPSGRDVAPSAADVESTVADQEDGGTAPLYAFTGGYRMSVGATRDDFFVKDANGDLNEREFRIISGDLHENTYDPAIYSRVWVDIDTTREEGWNMHTKIVIDPWSFIGTTDKFIIYERGGPDQAEVQLKWWGANNQIINQTIFTGPDGDGLNIPEIEVEDGQTVETTLGSTFALAQTPKNQSNFFIPSREIKYKFHPVREFWLDYATDTLQLRLIPTAYEDQVVTSDDPLQLSNHHIYWDVSPWMDEWRPGLYHSTSNDFTRGRWTNDLTFFTRDSDLQRLNVFRGATLAYQPSDLLTFQSSIAAPKTLWEDYEQFNRFAGMARLKYQALEQMTVGGTYTSRWAYNSRKLDAFNNVYSVDTAITPTENLKIEAQLATSHSGQDNTSDYRSKTRGHAWHTAVEWGNGGGETLTEEAKEEGDAPSLFRTRMYYTHMDEAFDPGLASYRHTRNDLFWGRHVSFYRPLALYKDHMQSLHVPVQQDGDIMAFRIGDGVDTGRDVIGARLETKLFDQRIMSLYDARRVNDTDNQYIEFVARTEHTWLVTPRLTGKFLFLYHDRPKSRGVDPYVSNAGLNVFLDNTSITDEEPSTMTFSVGGEYIFTDNLAGWFVYERTQDAPFGGSDNFPRDLYNDFSFGTFTSGDQTIRHQTVFLYNNGVFPLPEYPWYDIYKAGLHWRASDILEGNVTWTRNEYEFAGQVDDNMNHIGFEMAFHPNDRFTVLGKYTLSHSVDVARILGGGDAVNTRHHNMYFQGRYRVTNRSEFVAEYGVGSVVPPATIFSVSPVGQYFPVLDTQHILRLSYTAEF